MKRPVDEREAKLPKWAQSQLAALRADVEGWKAEAHTVGVDGDSPIYIERYDEDKVRLPSLAVVSFDLRYTFDDVLTETGGRIDVKHEGDHLQIWGVGIRMSDGITIAPVSSNRVKLGLSPWE
jgi:hypothetical protein